MGWFLILSNPGGTLVLVNCDIILHSWLDFGKDKKARNIWFGGLISSRMLVVVDPYAVEHLNLFPWSKLKTANICILSGCLNCCMFSRNIHFCFLFMLLVMIIWW